MPDNVLFLLFDADVLFVLRKRTAEDEQSYILIGPAYVHGLPAPPILKSVYSLDEFDKMVNVRLY